MEQDSSTRLSTRQLIKVALKVSWGEFLRELPTMLWTLVFVTLLISTFAWMDYRVEWWWTNALLIFGGLCIIAWLIGRVCVRNSDVFEPFQIVMWTTPLWVFVAFWVLPSASITGVYYFDPHRIERYTEPRSSDEWLVLYPFRRWFWVPQTEGFRIEETHPLHRNVLVTLEWEGTVRSDGRLTTAFWQELQNDKRGESLDSQATIQRLLRAAVKNAFSEVLLAFNEATLEAQLKDVIQHRLPRALQRQMRELLTTHGLRIQQDETLDARLILSKGEYWQIDSL